MRRLNIEEKGNDSVEYALLAAFIAVVIVGTVTVVGTTINRVFAMVTGLFPR